MAKTFNYNHKPQYIAIKTYPIMPCALPLSAFLTFAMSICTNFYSGTSSIIESSTSANVKYSSGFVLIKINKNY